MKVTAQISDTPYTASADNSVWYFLSTSHMRVESKMRIEQGGRYIYLRRAGDYGMDQ